MPHVYLYAKYQFVGVTNLHNVCRDAACVIRANCKVCEPDAIAIEPDQWAFISGGTDLAISPPIRVDPGSHDMSVASIETLLTKEEEASQEIDVADDVFMIGRFIDFDGKETNEPAYRFGHISTKDARVQQSTGYNGRSIVLDMHSRTGFSGSPVSPKRPKAPLHLTTGTPRTERILTLY